MPFRHFEVNTRTVKDSIWWIYYIQFVLYILVWLVSTDWIHWLLETRARNAASPQNFSGRPNSREPICAPKYRCGRNSCLCVRQLSDGWLAHSRKGFANLSSSSESNWSCMYINYNYFGSVINYTNAVDALVGSRVGIRFWLSDWDLCWFICGLMWFIHTTHIRKFGHSSSENVFVLPSTRALSQVHICCGWWNYGGLTTNIFRSSSESADASVFAVLSQSQFAVELAYPTEWSAELWMRTKKLPLSAA